MKTLREKLKALPAGRRKLIERSTALLIEEEMTMRELRQARKMTQAAMARKLGIRQEQVSRIEKRTDWHLSRLRRSIEATGGELTLVGKFPKRASVRLTGFAEAEI